MKKAIIGRKVGMTQYFVGDDVVPVSVVAVDKNIIVQIKTEAVDGYSAVQLGYYEIPEKRTSKQQQGHFKKAGVKPVRYLKEFKLEGDYEVAGEITCDIFETGDVVDVTGICKGKGFAGAIKKGAHRGPETHGSKSHRVSGSLGACSDPSRVFKGKTMPGHLGATRVTTQNLAIVAVDTDLGVILVKGAIPGPNKGIVYITSAVKAKKDN
jgi:large subunit ribosomal protein L3